MPAYKNFKSSFKKPSLMFQKKEEGGGNNFDNKFTSQVKGKKINKHQTNRNTGQKN